MGPVWEDADGEEIVNETFTRLEKAFHGRTNWGLLLKVEAIIVATTMIVAHLALHVGGRLSHRLLQRHSEDSPPFGLVLELLLIAPSFGEVPATYSTDDAVLNAPSVDSVR